LSKDAFQPFDVASYPGPASSAFLEGLTACPGQAPVWSDFAAGHALRPFTAPLWETLGSAEAPPADVHLPDGVQEQIASLLRSAEADAQRLKDAAYAEGFARGEQEGFAAAQQQIQGLVQSLGQALHEVGRLRAHICEQSEGELLELVLAIVRKVLHEDAEVPRDRISALLRAGIKKLSRRQEVRVKVHPRDLLVAKHCKAQLLEALDGTETITVEEDDTVPPGSCVIDAPTEIVDLRWDEQLAAVAASLRETYDRARRGEAA
jgi:flagellar assembly protein FliH